MGDNKGKMMKNIQNDIKTMMQAFGQETPVKPCPDTVSTDVLRLRYDLIHEEVRRELLPSLELAINNREFGHSISESTQVNIADGIIDSIVVIVGTGIALGLDLTPLWDEVQRANMDKSTGPKRADGKRLKPEGWQPPRIKELLIEQGAKL